MANSPRDHEYARYSDQRIPLHSANSPRDHEYARCSDQKIPLHSANSPRDHEYARCMSYQPADLSGYHRRSTVIINNQNYMTYDVPGDGSCFFHCLSLHLHGETRWFSIYRELICQHVFENWNQYRGTALLHHDLDPPTARSYWHTMLHLNGYATGCEMGVAAELLSQNVKVFMQGHNQKGDTCFHETIFQTGNDSQIITLLLVNNHFNLLRCTQQKRRETQISVQSQSEEPTTKRARQIDTGTHSSDFIQSESHQPNDDIERLNMLDSLPEKKLLHQHRKYGVHYESPIPAETINQRTLRRKRNKYKMNKQQELLGTILEVSEPAPHSVDAQFNKAMDCIRSFELREMSHRFNLCSTCSELRLNLPMADKVTCKRCSKDRQIVKKFSKENSMDPGDIPLELQNLSMVEQQLICKLSPAINIHMLSHGGIAANGHCVTFPQQINEPGQIFPRLPQEVNIIRVRKMGRNETSKEFRVRRYDVQSALIWLKQNNPAYSDIIISQERLELLPLDDDLPNLQTMEYKPGTVHGNDQGPAPEQIDPGNIVGETNSGVLLAEPVVDIHGKIEKVVREVVGENHGKVTINKRGVVTIPWPTRSDTPVSEYTTRHFFTMSFPWLFPYGEGDFFMNRPRTCDSMSDWAEHLLWYKDGRFARSEYFKFIVHNMIMRKRTMENSSYIVQQQLGDEHLTVDILRENLEKGDQSFLKKILYFSASLRGTSQYWLQRDRELKSLVQFQINQGKGLPSYFSTGSCAEFHFKPLRRLLENYIECTSGQKPDLDDRNVLFCALQKNTHIVGHYFDVRTQDYFQEFMTPVFGIDTFWYRYEFAKSRGMIHWHGLFWRSDQEPHHLMSEAVKAGLSEQQQAKELSDWAHSILGMTASHPAGEDKDGNPRKDLWPPPEGSCPAPPDNQNPLIKLLMDVSQSQDSILEDHLLLTNRINLHRCSDYCLTKKKAKKGDKRCRMEFGTENNPGKELRSEPALVKDKNGSLRLEMRRDHPMLVQHSSYHTQGWRANGDVSIIVSKSPPENPSINEIIAVERYVSGYACKGNEPTGATADLFRDVINSPDDTCTAKSLCTKLLMSTVKRDISAVEASYELSGLPLYHCSHQFQTLSLTGSRVLEKDGKTLTKSTPLDKYLARNEKDVSSWYEFVANKKKVPVIAGSNTRATWPLPEDFCRTMLLIHWPNWRKICDIKPPEASWTETFQVFLDSDKCPIFVIADVERAKRHHDDDENDSDSEAEDQPVEHDQPEWMELLRPNVEFEPEEFKYDDGGPDHDWSVKSLNYPPDLGHNWMEDIMSTTTQFDEIVHLPEVDLTTMNKEQQFAFNIVMERLLVYKQNPSSFKNYLRLTVSGTAGSGKSYLIKCLVRAIRILFHSNKSVQVVCPTGCSANLIDGVTLHSFLHVPTSSKANKEMNKPDGQKGKNLQENCKDLVALLVDERSLVGSKTLGWMEFLCSCGRTKETTASWGGLPVVVFLGDDIQLPPVCDSPVYNTKGSIPAALHGGIVWKEFTRGVNLKTIIRQDESQARLKDTLYGLRNYNLTKDQAEWLQSFQWDSLRKSHGANLLNRMDQDGLFVFPTHQQEWNHNKRKLLEANISAPVVKVQAITEGIHKNLPADKASGLCREVYLCKGAKVVLTSNLNVQVGLFNGSMGKVIDIIFENGNQPSNSQPDVVMVEFSKYTGPPFITERPQIVPIMPIERRLDCRCHRCKRKMIPLRLGWGTTIHRCQGMTIGDGEPNRYIVIHPGSNKFESRNPGALFVALSRAKSAGVSGGDPDFAWHQSCILNVDRLRHIVQTPTTLARSLTE